MAAENKVAIVTGASRGIGRAIAQRLVSAHWRVLAVQRSSPELRGVEHLETDLVNPALDRIEQALAATDGADALINNAGVMHEARVDKLSASEWQRTLAINLTAPFLLTRLVAPWMRRRGGGAIVNVGSIEGIGANPEHAAYSASKAGLHGLTRAIAVDLGQFGIRCNAVAPGWIDTELNEAFVASMPEPRAFRQDLGMIHPLGRTGSPEEVAALVVWLISDEAAFVTGQTYVVDGGRTAKLSLP